MSEFETALRLASTGDTTGLEESLREFRVEVDEAVAPLGFDAAGDEFDADLERLGFEGELPVAPAREPVTITAAAVAVVVFVGLALGQWAVEKVADGVWAKLSPSVGRLFGRAAQRRPGSPIVVSLSTWFSESKVMVVVETTNQPRLETIVGDACNAALAWLVANPRENVKLIYRYADGKLSESPLVTTV